VRKYDRYYNGQCKVINQICNSHPKALQISVIHFHISQFNVASVVFASNLASDGIIVGLFGAQFKVKFRSAVKMRLREDAET